MIKCPDDLIQHKLWNALDNGDLIIFDYLTIQVNASNLYAGLSDKTLCLISKFAITIFNYETYTFQFF